MAAELFLQGWWVHAHCSVFPSFVLTEVGKYRELCVSWEFCIAQKNPPYLRHLEPSGKRTWDSLKHHLLYSSFS